MLRRLPRILRFIPGTAQDVRAYFLSMQYWLGGSDDNIEQHDPLPVSRYRRRRHDWRARSRGPGRLSRGRALSPARCPDRDHRDAATLPRPAGADGTVGLLMLRSYVLAARHRRTMTA